MECKPSDLFLSEITYALLHVLQGVLPILGDGRNKQNEVFNNNFKTFYWTMMPASSYDVLNRIPDYLYFTLYFIHASFYLSVNPVNFLTNKTKRKRKNCVCSIFQSWTVLPFICSSANFKNSRIPSVSASPVLSWRLLPGYFHALVVYEVMVWIVFSSSLYVKS